MREQNQTIYQDHKELFDLADTIDEFARAMLEEFNKKQIKLFDLFAYQRIFLFIVTRSLKTYTSILLLCEQGYGQDVSALLRSLLENLVTVQYILHDKKKADDMAKRFVAYKWVIFKRHLPEQEQQLEKASTEEREEFDKKKAMILKHVEEFKRDFRVTSDRALVTWSGKTVRDMAKQVNKELLEEYETTFRLCSRFSHPSILGDQEYVIQNDKNLVFSPLPSSIGVVPNLRKAIKFALEFIKIIDQIFEFHLLEKIKQLEQEFENVSRLEKYNKDTTHPKKDEQKSVSIRECFVVFKAKDK